MLKIKIAVSVIVIAAVVLFVWHYRNLVEENKALTAAVSSANSTIEKLDRKNDAEKIITNDSERIINDIRKTKKSDDAPVAPVLDRTLDAIGGM